MPLDFTAAADFVDRLWHTQIVPELVEYIRIPNKSPAFDGEWEAHGHMEQAVQQFAAWAGRQLQDIPGATREVVRLPGRTPLLYLDIPGQAAGTVLLYGHLDKQPEMVGWAAGKGPWNPVIEGERLYGRGGADDGYALFAALAAIRAVRAQALPHARCVVLIEACEESGSPDLPAYVEHLAPRIGSTGLVVCLDSGCGNYDQLWLTTSLRGMVLGNLTVRVLAEGVHSGVASGIVPSSFRILRSLLSRIEDEATGQLRLPELQAPIPPERRLQARQTAAILGDEVWSSLPFAGHTRPMGEDGADLILQRTWLPQLAVTAVAGYPLPENGGNVLLPFTTARLSLRVPPTADAERARLTVKQVLEADPPYGAQVSFDAPRGENGWNAPPLAPWLARSLQDASMAAFGRPAAFQGEGGSIPFMGMLGERFPSAQFVVTGVLGPQSNAHGPNEFLHLPFARRLTACIACVLTDHARAGD